MLAHKKIALLHVVKKQLGWDEETYREVLNNHAGVKSSKALDYAGFLAVMDHAEQCGFVSFWKAGAKKNKKLKYAEFEGRRGDFASPAQMRKVNATWMNNARVKTDKAMNNWLKNRFGINDIRWMMADQVTKVLEGIREMGKREKRAG